MARDLLIARKCLHVYARSNDLQLKKILWSSPFILQRLTNNFVMHSWCQSFPLESLKMVEWTKTLSGPAYLSTSARYLNFSVDNHFMSQEFDRECFITIFARINFGWKHFVTDFRNLRGSILLLRFDIFKLTLTTCDSMFDITAVVCKQLNRLNPPFLISTLIPSDVVQNHHYSK